MKIIKLLYKLLTFIMPAIIILTVFSFITFTPFAATSRTCGDNLTWEYDESTFTLTISGTGEMNDYSISNYNDTNVTTAPWRLYYQIIEAIVIENGVTSIGDSAFAGCTGFTSITIPDSVMEIGANTFAECFNLATVKLPDSMTRIGAGAFYSCLSLRGMTIPEGIREIEPGTFSACMGPFSYVIIPDSVTSIGSAAFNHCQNLDSITIPDSVTFIGDYAFQECHALKSISIPDSVTSIGELAFTYCYNLESITVDDDNTFYQSAGNCLIETKTKALIVGCDNSVIPTDGSITSIGRDAFRECNELTSVTIPSSVTSIGSNAFGGCDRLTKVNYTGNIADWCKISFSRNIGYFSPVYVSNPLAYAKNLYINDELITDLIIPSVVNSISSCAFCNCSGITNVTISDSVTSIEYGAFYGCTGLKTVCYCGTEEEWNNISIDSSNSYLTSADRNYHLYNNEWFIRTSPTCAVEGLEYSSCTVCGEERTRTIKALGHTGGTATCHSKAVCTRCHNEYGEFDPNNHDGETEVRDAKASTCTEKGYTGDTYCLGCGDKISSGSPIAKTAHTYSAVVTDPTCTAQGYTTYTCTRCGDTYVDDYTDALGHKAGAVVKENEKAPTCEEDGSYDDVVYCTVCGAELSRETKPVAKLGHTWGEWTVTTDPTCIAKGEETRVCTNDRAHIEKRDVEPLGHDYKAVVTDPTCTVQGYTTYTCARCGNSYVDNYVNATNHVWGVWVTLAPATCTTNGAEMRICANDPAHVENRYIPELGHDYRALVTAPTCTEQGYTTYTCSRCRDSYIADYTSSLGHIGGTATCHSKAVCMRCDNEYGGFDPSNHNGETEMRDAKSATCTGTGYTGDTYCLGCGVRISNGKKTSALGHIGGIATCHSKAICERCGNEYGEYNPVNHKGLTEIRNSICATCTEDGYSGDIYCLSCGVKLVTGITIAATGHDYHAFITSPTCTAQGYTKHICYVCGDSYVDNFNDALGHNYIPVVTDPTCTDRGYTTYTCSNCDDSYITNYTEPTGHTSSDWIIDIEPTVSTTGKRHKECTLCGEIVETEIIPDIHTPGDINADGRVNNKDLTRLFQYLSGWSVEVNELALDVNGDGKQNNKDLTRLFQYLTGWEVEIY